jgi:hypothetical protein
MLLGIVGSRNFHDYELFKEVVLKIVDIIKVKCIISGGALGTDTLAEKLADEYKIEKQIFNVTKEDWKKYGKSAGPRRNTLIVENSEFIIAFPSKYGKGTQDTIRKAKEKRIPTKILYID